MRDRDRLGVVPDDVRRCRRPCDWGHGGGSLVCLDGRDGHFIAPSDFVSGDGMEMDWLGGRRCLLPEIEGPDILALAKFGRRAGENGDAVFEHRGTVGITK